MSSLRWHRFALLCSLPLWLIWTPAAAQRPASQDLPLDAHSLIQRVQQASQRRSFIGTFVVSSNGQMTSSRITHFGDGHDQIELIEPLDGQPRKVFRHNDEVHVLWPQTRHASIERRETMHGFPTALDTTAAQVLDRYEIEPGGDERIAGHAAQVVQLKPRDTYRFAQRWWLERQSGLLLRADLLGDHGEVLESAAFSTLQIGARVLPQPLLSEMNRLDGYKVSRSALAPTQLGSEGWSLTTPVPGFRSVSCIRRPSGHLPRQDGSGDQAHQPVSGAPGTLLQAIFGDGLTHVSIFIEPYQARAGRTETEVAMGATRAVTHRLGDWWITAVGDVPSLTLRKFVQALQRSAP
ncbi:MAG: hypothetical protein RLY71_3733 [Pseudomonadota bacterium]|jgi:sigma-E factor negative regulatory protein RseB